MAVKTVCVLKLLWLWWSVCVWSDSSRRWPTLVHKLWRNTNNWTTGRFVYTSAFLFDSSADYYS